MFNQSNSIELFSEHHLTSHDGSIDQRLMNQIRRFQEIDRQVEK